MDLLHKKTQDIIGIGSLFVDYFFEVPNNFFTRYKLQPEDDVSFNDIKITSKYFINSFPVLSKSPGGISANTIAVLSSLGISSGYYGVIGKDTDALYWEKNIGKIDTSHLIQKGFLSFCACVLSSSRETRAFISNVNKYDNDFFKNVDYNYLNSAKIIHIGPFFLNPKESLKELKKIVSNIDKPYISFSPASVYLRFGIKELQPILEKTYVLFVNEDELYMLTKLPAKKGSKILLKFGVQIIVCTQGAKGVLVTTQNEQFFVPAKEVKKLVDTTGAGDAFAAGFLYGILKNKSLQWSSEFGVKLASKAVKDYGLHWLKKFM